MLAAEALVERARGGDSTARNELVARTSLRGARVILGDAAEARLDLVRELAQGDDRFGGMAELLCAIVRDGDRALRDAFERVYRARRDRWNREEIAAAAQVAEAHGARLGGELALELVEWSEEPGFVQAALKACADVPEKELEPLAWRGGFERMVVRAPDSELVLRWTTTPVAAKAVGKAVMSAHARGDGRALPALDVMWTRAANREVLAAGIAAGASSGMSGADEVSAWAWRRFVAHPEERAHLYKALPWREAWKERRAAEPIATRPAPSAAEHLKLWGGLDLERLSETVDDAVRIARPDELAALVDVAFELANVAPREHRLHALAGACRIGYEVRNQACDGDGETEYVREAADRLLARIEATAGAVRASGGMLEQYVANRVEDLEDTAKMIRDARARRAERAKDAAEREERKKQQEEQRRQAEEVAAAARAQAQAQAQAAQEAAAAAAAARAAVAAQLAAAAKPLPANPIDDEIFFSALPAAPTLGAYVRLFRRISRDPMGVQSLAADGVTMEMFAVITQTWSAMFASRPDLAMRFSQLVSAP